MCIRDRCQTETVGSSQINAISGDFHVHAGEHGQGVILAGSSCNLGNSFGEKPVSYTHLDVYKRQVRKFPSMQFGSMKQIVDWTLVIIAGIISLIAMGELVGVREGAIFAAFFIGFFVKQWRKLCLRSIGY